MPRSFTSTDRGPALCAVPGSGSGGVTPPSYAYHACAVVAGSDEVITSGDANGSLTWAQRFHGEPYGRRRQVAAGRARNDGAGRQRSGSMRDGLRFGLLGPPVLYEAGDTGDAVGSGDGRARGAADGDGGRSGGGVRSVGSGKMRALFVALLLEPGRVVSVDTLKDVLWDATPPPSAQASLHNHVTRLRRLLDDPERLRAIPPGYLLRVDDGELDVRVFEAHARAARTAHAGRDWTRTVRESAAALALWRGTPLGGLPVEELRAQAFVQRLEEARLLLLERRYEAELHLAADTAHEEATGAHALGALVPELTALVAEHPLREAFHRLLMLVLHRTGRQAEALAVHRDLRARLLDELGVEPGPAVRDAHVEILREREPEPLATQADPPPRSSRHARPNCRFRRLHFTGRGEVLAELRRVLDPSIGAPSAARGSVESAATAAWKQRMTTTDPHPPPHGPSRAHGCPAPPKGTATAVISGMAACGQERSPSTSPTNSPNTSPTASCTSTSTAPPPA